MKVGELVRYLTAADPECEVVFEDAHEVIHHIHGVEFGYKIVENWEGDVMWAEEEEYHEEYSIPVVELTYA